MRRLAQHRFYRARSASQRSPIRHYTDTGIFPAVKGLALLSTLLTILGCLVIHGQGMLNSAGEPALLSMTVFMVGMGLITYHFGFGLKQDHAGCPGDDRRRHDRCGVLRQAITMLKKRTITFAVSRADRSFVLPLLGRAIRYDGTDWPGPLLPDQPACGGGVPARREESLMQAM